MTLPADCNSMAELRAEIDRLDAQLVQMLVRRAAFIDRAAELKPAENLPARIDTRVAEVIDNVRGMAADHGLDPALAEDVWRTLIEWSIAREERLLSR
ncbi:chorismate mutase [Pontivivens nitratireducens]|uniref:chorismate mutase n=1 Tax=Pontivivens nitratireducens TaxID=2758038 RepID=A0A6G7VHF3_9RHOB|nr:chorismate mutase [Pontibrevibacter nitratireducens]QIK39523.1 chorismate mutase [Pontibrevibacter nitratireducens]